MVYSIAAEKGDMLEWAELEHAIRRNFGGLDEIDAVEIFRNHVKTSFSYTMVMSNIHVTFWNKQLALRKHMTSWIESA